MGHSTMSRLAVFASGSGSNFQSLVNAVEEKDWMQKLVY